MSDSQKESVCFYGRAFWVLLVLGVLLRSLHLFQPILDAHPTRQTHTADLVRGMIAEPGFQAAPIVSWRGDLEARFLWELPLYNWMTEATWRGMTLLSGESAPDGRPLNGEEIRRLDGAGRLVSISLWAAGFCLLQAVWRRFLQPPEALVANLFFVFSPLSLFFGQAFMPEMLIQLIAIAFVWLSFRYAGVGEPPPGTTAKRLGLMAAMTVLGILGMTVKAPEFTHYAVFLVLLLITRQGWQAVVLRPSHYLAAAVILAAALAWSQQFNRVNAAYFQEWTSSESFVKFLGTMDQRLQSRFYVKVGAYVGFLLATPVGVILALAGLGAVILRRKEARYQVAGFWFISLVFFYAVWGPHTAGGHSYYNLPGLAPLAALAGMGALALWNWAGSGDLARRLRPWVAGALAMAFAAVAVVGVLYQSDYDRVVYHAAKWTSEQTPPGAHVIIKLNHEPLGVDYPQQPVFSYYSCRPTWVWTKVLPPEEKARALEKARYVVETIPQPFGALRQFALKMGATDAKNWEDISGLLQSLQAREIHRTPEFVVYEVPPR